MDDINKLCKIIISHPSFEHLGFGRCKGDDINGYEMLKTIMNAGRNKLKVIELCNHDISTDGGTYISDFFATNPILHTLNLEYNRLNDNDAIGIAKALKQNINLRFLRLTNNNISKTGWKALRKAEFDDSSLNSASGSNHSCVIKYPPDGSDVIEGLDISEMNGGENYSLAFIPIFVRQKKIYSVLSSKNRDCSNVDQFDGVCLLSYCQIC